MKIHGRKYCHFSKVNLYNMMDQKINEELKHYCGTEFDIEWKPVFKTQNFQ